MSKTIIGLDISLTGTGMCRMQSEFFSDGKTESIRTIEWTLFGVGNKQAKGVAPLSEHQWECARIGRVFTKVMEFVGQPDLVVIEDFAFGIQNAGARTVAGLSFLIRYKLFTSKIPFVVISPPSLKKFISGRAAQRGQDGKMHGTPKAVIIRDIFDLFGHRVDDDNEADAVGLAYVGAALLGVYGPERKPQREMLDAFCSANNWVIPSCEQKRRLA